MRRMCLVLAAVVGLSLLVPIAAAEAVEQVLAEEQSDTPTVHVLGGTNDLPVIPIPPTPSEPTRLMGDADGNGSLSYMDALMVLRHSIGLSLLSEDVVQFCDVNGDGEINYMDALQILRRSIGLIDNF